MITVVSHRHEPRVYLLQSTVFLTGMHRLFVHKQGMISFPQGKCKGQLQTPLSVSVRIW